jgi:hypothetical protein
MLRRSGLSVAPRFLWECLTNRTVSWFPSPATSNGACRFPALRSPARFARRFMGRSQWAVLSILMGHQPLLHTLPPLPSSPSWISSAHVLQIAERFCQTPLPPIIARGITKQRGSFAPWELPQFIATLNPSHTFSPSSPFPVQPVIGRTCSRTFRSGTSKVSPVASHVLVTVLPLPPRRSVMSLRSARAMPCCLRPEAKGPASGSMFCFEATSGFTCVAAR